MIQPSLEANLVTQRLPGKPEQLATSIVFLIGGLGLASWAPLVPFAKERAALSEATLGLLLLCLGAGSLLTMTLAGALCSRWGCRSVIAASILLVAVTLPLLAFLSSFPLLVVALLLFGAGIGSLDVSMNVQGIILEKANGRPMMSTFHGLFSLGGILGALLVAGLLSLGFPPAGITLFLAALIVAALAAAFSRLLPYGSGGSGSRSSGPAFAMPRGYVLFLGIMCLIAFMAEGFVLDWSAVFLVSTRDVAPSQAGIAYVTFAITMTTCRLLGGRIVKRFGEIRTTAAGGIIAVLGILLSISIPHWQTSLIGWAIFGIGCSNLAPIMFSLVGRHSEMPESTAVPAITTLGYLGMLMGPAAIGFVADLTSLSIAFLLIAVLLVGVSVSARALRE